MSNRYASRIPRPGPQKLHAPGIKPSPSKRSFHTDSSDSTSAFADASAISTKSEKRKISPVFQDLATAHSLITSGKAKNLTSPERQHYRKRSSSSGDSYEQSKLVNKRADGLGLDLQTPQATSFGRDWGEERQGVLKFDDDDDDDDGDEQDDGKSQIPQTRVTPSSPLRDDGAFIRRPQTPLIPKLWDIKATNSANRPPLAGGHLSDVQWPSTNPYNQHSPYQRLSRQSSGISSPLGNRPGNETYPASAYGRTNGPTYSSPHGLPSPIVSKSGSGSTEDPRSSYPLDGMRMDEYDAGVRNKDNYLHRNYVYDAPTHFTENQESQSSRSVPQHSEGSTVNHILDHYTHGSGGSYYADGSKDALSQTPQTPNASRRLEHATYISRFATPSTELDEESDLSLRRFPDVPSPAYHKTASSANAGYSSYGDSHQLLDNHHQSGRQRESLIPPPPPSRRSQIAKGRRIPPPVDIGRQVSNAFRDFDQDDSYVEVSSPVIKKPIAAKLQLRPRKPVEGSFQKVNNSKNSSSGDISNDGTIRRGEYSSDKENIPPRGVDREFAGSGYVSNDGSFRREKYGSDKENIAPRSMDREFAGSDRIVEDIRIETSRDKNGAIVRKISKRRAPVADDDDQDEWETVLESDVYASPAAHLPSTKGIMANYGNFRQTGSSIANVSDSLGKSSSGAIRGPYFANERVLVHPARGYDVYEKNARALPGFGRTYLPVPEVRHGGFGSNSFRGTPAKLFRSLSQHLSSPRASSSPRHEYIELDEVKKGASSPYSPPRKLKPPIPMQIIPRESPKLTYGGLKLSTVPWGTDGAQSRYPSDDGWEFDQNQRPERPDSYMEMIKSANRGKLPWFLQTSSPSGSSGKSKAKKVAKQVEKAPRRHREPYEPYHEQHHEPYCERYGEPYTNKRLIRYPPRIYSTTNSIADYSDDEASWIDPLDGPEYDNPPASSNGRSHGRTPILRHNRGQDESSGYSPQTESAAGNRSKTSQKPLAPGGLYNKLASKFYSRRRARKADLESGLGLGISCDPPQDNSKLRPLIMKPTKKPSVVNPRAPHEFQYRSPLAPIQSPTWEKLYRASHLARINNALADNPHLQRPSPAYFAPDGTRMATSNSWVVSPGSPHLWCNPHDRSSVNPLAARKEKISWWALVGCIVLFCPLLLLYTTGLLDWAMTMYTKGDIRSFGMRQKKWAGWTLTTMCILAIIAAIAVLAATNKMGMGSS